MTNCCSFLIINQDTRLHCRSTGINAPEKSCVCTCFLDENERWNDERKSRFLGPSDVPICFTTIFPRSQRRRSLVCLCETHRDTINLRHGPAVSRKWPRRKRAPPRISFARLSNGRRCELYPRFNEFSWKYQLQFTEVFPPPPRPILPYRSSNTVVP